MVLNDLDNISQLAEALCASNRWLSTAESCTGGGIGYRLTAVSGSSAWYKGGIIAYCNELKTDLLKVPRLTLQEFGAVSEQTAHMMAKGAAVAMNTEVSISVTGIAGPDGGTLEKPVGTVCFGWSIDSHVFTETKHFEGERQQVRCDSENYAISHLVALL